MSAKTPTPEQQVQDDLYRLEAYRAQFAALAQQHQLLAASYLEHTRAKAALDGFDQTGKDAELLLPLGAETFVRGSIEPDGRVLIGIGSGLVTEMERGKAQEILAQRTLEIEKATGDLERNLRTLEERISALSARLDALTRAAEAEERRDGGGDVGRD